jgi:acetyltransferase-like isoleucine patch superfamily enzyme
LYWLRVFHDLRVCKPAYIAPSARLDFNADGYGRLGRISANVGLRLSHGAILSPYGGSINLGANVYIGPYSVIYGQGGVVIGENTLIAMHCRIVSSNHTIPEQGVDIRSQPDMLLPTRIGRDVWLGAGVTVLGGVKIGDGCIVGAASLVASDLPDNAIAFGSPATVRRFRSA